MDMQRRTERGRPFADPKRARLPAGGRAPLADGERDALAELVRATGPRLLAYVRRVYGAAEAEDVVAETYCRAAQNMRAVLRAERPELYLLTTARNLCRDAFRRRRPRDERPPEQACEAADAVAESEQMESLRSAVAALPVEIREVVVLRLSTGLKFEELAEMLGVPLGTALSRMHQAVERLRLALGSGHEPG